ncbi:hypothetical protein FRC02_009937 [Tulasnella sp. 418]|nr:hypothetical protein FRC02_009937 [Tulasnella sp. 418]
MIYRVPRMEERYVADCIKEIRLESKNSIDGALPPDTPISLHQDTKSFEDDFDPSTFMYTMDTWHFPTAEDSPSRTILSTTLSVETFRHQVMIDFLQPVPPYEACAPIDRNITYDNAPGDKAILKFIPFADDDDFVTDETGLREFLEKNEGVEEWAYAWELPGRDPDGMLQLPSFEDRILISSCSRYNRARGGFAADQRTWPYI